MRLSLPNWKRTATVFTSAVLVASIFAVASFSIVLNTSNQNANAGTFPGVNGKIAFASDRNGNDEIYVMNADGNVQTRLIKDAAGDVGPDWGAAPSVQPTSVLTVKTQDMNGNTLKGYWTVLRDSAGNKVATGFTPEAFTVNTGQQYSVKVSDYRNIVFDHWLDTGSQIRLRPITLNTDQIITAVMRDTNAPPSGFPIIHMSDTTTGDSRKLYSSSSIRVEYVTPTSQLIGDKIDQITVRLAKVGTPVGSTSIGVFDALGNNKKAFGAMDVSTISTSFTDYTFSLFGSDLYTIVSGDRIGIFYLGGSSTNYVKVVTDTNIADPFDGTKSYRQWGNTGGPFQSATAEDMYMILKQTHG